MGFYGNVISKDVEARYNIDNIQNELSIFQQNIANIKENILELEDEQSNTTGNLDEIVTEIKNIKLDITELTKLYNELIDDFNAALKLLGGHESWVS
jgi:chromosome segregation ATPase